jgi:predicted dehydrogenase
MKSETTRRSFLSGAAAAAGAFTIVAPQSVRGSQANSQIAVGLVGCGGRGSYDASIANADPRAKVMALCDRFPDQYDKSETTIKSQNTRKYNDFEKLLGAADIDAVFIVTPPFEHPRMLEAAVQAKKHIYLEKPIGVDVEGVKRAMAAAKKADKTKTIAVGFQQRYGPVYLEGYKRLQSGAIGEVANARGAWIANDPFTRKPYSDPAVEKIRNWFCYKEYSGDIIVEQDCHILDDLHWFLGGLPTAAIGRGNKKVRKDMDILDNLSVIYAWPKEFFVNFEANQLTPRGFNRIGEEFTGTKGTIATSRTKMTHYIAQGKSEEMLSKRDITIDAIEAFLTRIVENNPENAVERSALSTCIALLGRTAIYSGREATWKGDIGIAIA